MTHESGSERSPFITTLAERSTMQSPWAQDEPTEMENDLPNYVSRRLDGLVAAHITTHTAVNLETTDDN